MHHRVNFQRYRAMCGKIIDEAVTSAFDHLTFVWGRLSCLNSVQNLSETAQSTTELWII